MVVLLKKKVFFLSLLLGLFLFVFQASALLISPAALDVEYEEGGQIEFDVTIINDISQDIVIEMSYESYEGKIDYTDYFVAEGYPTNKVPIPRGSEKTVHFTMTYPEIESFGDIRFAFIRFYQAPFDSNADIRATVAVRIPIDTTVPYPNKYVKVEMSSYGTVAPGDTVALKADLTSLGSQIIQDLDGSFIIRNEATEKEVPFDSGLTYFLQKETKTLTGSLDTAGMEAGKYDVSVFLTYDGEVKESDPVTLILGEEAVEIVDLQPDTFEAIPINPVTVTLLNLWVEDLSPSVSLSLVSDDGSTVQSSDFGVYTLPVAEEKSITGNLNLEDVSFWYIYLACSVES